MPTALDADAGPVVVTDGGLSREAVQDAVRIAAVVHAAAVTLAGEDHFFAADAQ